MPAPPAGRRRPRSSRRPISPPISPRSAASSVKLAGVGSFSYYEPGDFLALHRDIVACDITLLTCLRDTATGTSDRRGLRIYPAYARVPLTQLRSENAPAHIDVHLDRGQTAVLLGGIVPHEVLPMAEHQHRTVSVVCMTALT